MPAARRPSSGSFRSGLSGFAPGFDPPALATQGRGRKRLVVPLLLALPVASLLYFQAYEDARSASRRVGIGIEEKSGALVVSDVTPALPAAVAGLQAGDVLLELNGRAVTDSLAYDSVASDFRRGQPVAVQIRREGATLLLEVRPGTAFPVGRYLIEAAVVVAYLLLALVAFPHWKEDSRARLLFLFSYAVSLELALPEAASVIGAPVVTVFSACAYYLLTGAQMGLELHLSSVIPEPQSWLRRRPWVVPLFYAVGLGIGVVAATAFVTDFVVPGRLPLFNAELSSRLMTVSLPIWALAVAVLLAFQALRHPEPNGRHQAGLVLVGSLPWVLYILGTTLSSQFVETPSWVSDGLQQLFILCYPLAVLFAISRYRLFDIEVVVRRGLVYASLTAALILLFYGAVGAGGAVVAQMVEGTPSVWVIAGATLISGLLFAPLHRVIQHFVDDRFFPERTELRRRIVALASELAGRGKLPTMGEHLVQRLSDIFGFRSATLLVADPHSSLLLTLASTRRDPSGQFDQSFLLSPEDAGVQALARANRPLPADALAPRSPALAQRLSFFEASLAIPIQLAETMVALLLVSEKHNGEPFRSEELDLLELLSHHVASVLENARLYESATYDSLTGLMRRETVVTALRQEVARATRYRRPLAVGLADIDHFKRVNDTWGHLAGDAMLKLVARTLGAGLRSTDMVGRYGGEEFLFVLPETDLAGAHAVADKVRRMVEEVSLTTESGDVIRVTVSIGLTSLGAPWFGEDASLTAIVGDADLALLRAKSDGRNRVEPHPSTFRT